MRDFMAKRMSARARLAAGAGSALGVALLVAACSTGSSSTGAAGSSSPAGASSSSAAAASGGSGSTVITTVSSSAGTFLADGSGHAVYLWTKDSNGRSRSLAPSWSRSRLACLMNHCLPARLRR